MQVSFSVYVFLNTVLCVNSYCVIQKINLIKKRENIGYFFEILLKMYFIWKPYNVSIFSYECFFFLFCSQYRFHALMTASVRALSKHNTL